MNVELSSKPVDSVASLIYRAQNEEEHCPKSIKFYMYSSQSQNVKFCCDHFSEHDQTGLYLHCSSLSRNCIGGRENFPLSYNMTLAYLCIKLAPIAAI